MCLRVREWPTRIVLIQHPHFLTQCRSGKYPNGNQEEHYTAEDCIKHVGLIVLTSAVQEDTHSPKVEDKLDAWKWTGESVRYELIIRLTIQDVLQPGTYVERVLEYYGIRAS